MPLIPGGAEFVSFFVAEQLLIGTNLVPCPVVVHVNIDSPRRRIWCWRRVGSGVRHHSTHP
eukprot:5832715-Prorocentrum_lima.AAC.1